MASVIITDQGPGGATRVLHDPEPPFYIANASLAAQALTAETANYILGSDLRIPLSRRMSVGSIFRWRVTVTKTAASTANSFFIIKVGTNNNVADTNRLTFNKAAGTAAADVAVVDITCIVRVEGASGILAGNFRLTHNLASTGHATVPGLAITSASSAFDMTPTGLVVGLAITPGAAEEFSVGIVTAEALNLALAG